MNAMIVRRLMSITAVTSLVLCISGCYYVQAARGQLEIMRKREPIAEIINADTTPQDLEARLRVVRDARRFSIDTLGLPDNASYTSFADLERDYALWNVVAAPEFSLEPKRWCYPVVGCVSYRGYFNEVKARRLGEKLAEDGYDVLVGGVAAYSTLGKFSDPILNTMMRWADVDLVAVMFHELAHQLLYIKDDSGFNESFATAVEEFGIERWLANKDAPAESAAYYERRDLQRRLMDLVAIARADLEKTYAEPLDVDELRQRKQRRLAKLGMDASIEYASANRSAPEWWSSDLTNARLVSMTLYHGLLPKFRGLLQQCDNDLQCFYDAARALSELGKDARDAQLSAM